MDDRLRHADNDSLVGLLRGRHLHEPPAGTLRRALALASRLPAPRPTLVQWIVECLFDSAQSPALAGVRGSSVGERRLLYRLGPPNAPVGQIDLLLRREPNGSLALQGQVVPPVQGLTLSFSTGRSAKRKPVALSEVGDFYVRGLRPSRSGLTLEIVVPGAAPLTIETLRLNPPEALS